MPYRSQLTTSPYPTLGRYRTYHGSHGSVALEFTGEWHVQTTCEGKHEDYMTDSAINAVNYYSEQVMRVR